MFLCKVTREVLSQSSNERESALIKYQHMQGRFGTAQVQKLIAV